MQHSYTVMKKFGETVYVGTQDEGLLVYSPEQNSFTSTSISSGNVDSLVEFGGSLYVCADGKLHKSVFGAPSAFIEMPIAGIPPGQQEEVQVDGVLDVQFVGTPDAHACIVLAEQLGSRKLWYFFNDYSSSAV